MDTTDINIVFSKEGYCNHCISAIEILKNKWHKDGEAQLESIFERVKEENRGNEYDCIIGISGGVDSSYLAYIGHKYGLRMLGLHIDAGWNTKISERNIQKICKAYGIDLIVEKVNLSEMMDLQRAYFLAEVPNQDVPQDHAFFCALYQYAIKNTIRYVLNGSNLSSESIIASYFSYDAKDAVNLLDIHQKFGQVPLKRYPIMDDKTFYKNIPSNKALSVLTPLDFMDYDKHKAIEFLAQDCGFEYYGGKHLESRFTKLFQNYIQPQKFGHDKRTSHLSSLIISGQMTREQALNELKKPLYPDNNELNEDIRFFIERIGIDKETFDEIIARKPKSHFDYNVRKRYSIRTLRYHPRLGRYIIKTSMVLVNKPKIKKFARRIVGV